MHIKIPRMQPSGNSSQQHEQNVRSTGQELLPEEVFDVQLQPTENANDTQSSNQMKKRGATTMKILHKGPNKKMKVTFNEHEQPVCTNSTKFVSFLGVLARQRIPIVIEWKELGEEKWKALKDDIWSLVQESFAVSDTQKDTIFKMMARYWRQYKSKVTKEIHKANELPDRGRAFQLIRPTNVKSNKEWDTFVKQRLTTSFQATSNRFKEMRRKHKYTYTMSRKGYARLESEMKATHSNPEEITRVDLWTKAHQKKDGEPINEAVGDIMEQIKKCNESTEDPPSKDSIRDDALARVLGPEVRGLGIGATPSKVGRAVRANARVKELEAELKETKKRVGTIEAKMEMFFKSQEIPIKNVENSTNAHLGTPQSDQASYPTRGQTKDFLNAKCQLLNWYNFEVDEVVAEGHIASDDPNSKVHHVPLGKDCWKMWIDKVIDHNLYLYRPTDEFRKLGETSGSTIAWPKSHIKLLE